MAALQAPVLHLGTQTDTSVTVTWTDPNTKDRGTDIHRSKDGGNWVTVGTPPKGVQSFTDTKLPAVTDTPVQVAYRVRARGAGADGNSAWSNTVAATLPVPGEPPIEPPPIEPPPVTGDIVVAASLEFTSVKAAVEACPAGGTVRLPAGAGTWDLGEGPLVIDKQLILKGAGQDATIITDLGVDNIIKVVTVYGKPIRICHLQLVGGTVDFVSTTVKRNAGTQCIWAVGQGQVRVDHVTFDCTPMAPARPAGQGAVVQMRAFLAREGATGVFDHNLCRGAGGLRSAVHTQHNAWRGVGDFGDNSWASPTGWGQADSAMYYEDSVWELSVGTAASSMWMHDSFSGGRSVIRYNTLRNANIAAHGSEAGNRGRGTRLLEIYKNTAPNRTEGSSVFCDNRSGPIVVWGNTIGTGYTGLCRLDNNRSTQNFGTWLSADGSFPFDLNEGVVHESGTAGAGSGSGLLIDPTKDWNDDQWVGGRYSLRNTSPNVSTNDGRSEGSFITWNDATSIKTQPGTSSSGPIFHPGDTYQILRCERAMDQCGLGQGKLLKDLKPVLASTGEPGWPEQESDPCYSWDNTIGGSPNNNMTTPGVHIQPGVDYFNGTPKPGYTPLVHPHPLCTAGFTAGD